MSSDKEHSRVLYLIAAFKMIKGLALLAVGIGALKLLHKNSAEVLEHWVDLIRVDPDNRYIHRLIERVHLLDGRKLKELSVGTFFYSGLLLTEGIGLALRKSWAEYFTIIITSSLIPLEVYELSKGWSPAKGVILVINLGVVAYLVWVVRQRTN
ncbi:MAG: DUF2127 domain-containing protein [Candidatus Acidiferrum sp.]